MLGKHYFKHRKRRTKIKRKKQKDTITNQTTMLVKQIIYQLQILTLSIKNIPCVKIDQFLVFS